MSDYMKLVQACIKEAPNDEGAAGLLRSFVRGAADAAPVDALIEVAQTMVAIRQRDAQRFLERN